MKVVKLHNSNIISKINYCNLRFYITSRKNSTQPQPAESVVLTQQLENPIIVVPEKLKLDAIAFAKRVTSLRPNLSKKVSAIAERSQHTADLLADYEKSDIKTTLHVDMIGPPNPISKLRPIVRWQPANETYLHRKLRQLHDETQDWNEKFWSEHNSKFSKERDNYIKTRLKGEDRQTLTSEEMSEFYKAFLDRHWKTHVHYNFEWYKKNLTLVFLAFLAKLEFRQNL